jgi:hypothetical protein
MRFAPDDGPVAAAPARCPCPEPGSLRGTHVSFIHVEHARIDRERCPVTMQRIAQTNDLWRAAVQSAGATSSTITNSGLTLGDEQ